MKHVKNIYLLLFGLFVSFSIFILPNFIRPFKKTVSASYDYQFNNIVSVLGFLLSFAILFAYLFLKRLNNPSTYKHFFSNNLNGIMGKKHLVYASLFYLLIIYLLFTIKADYKFPESEYFLARLDRMALGKLPYKDFEYAYGLLLLGLPRFFNAILHSSSSVPGYYISYCIFSLLGLYCLYYTVNFFNIGTKYKLVIFYCLVFAGFPQFLGENYTFTRFALPVASLLAFSGLIKKYDRSNFYSIICVAVAAVLISLFNFLISVEIGIAVFIAITGYLLLSVFFLKKFYNLWVFACCLLLTAVALSFFDKDFVLIIKTFSSGGNNWPVIPSPTIVIFLLSFFTVNAFFAISIFKAEFSFLPFAFLCLNGILALAALGRCDPIHIFYDGMSTFICMWVYVIIYHVKFFKIYTVFYILIFCIGMVLSDLNLYKTIIIDSITEYKLHGTFIKSIEEKINQTHLYTFNLNKFKVKVPDDQDLKQLNSYQKIALPFDVDKDTYQYIIKNKLYVPDYYQDFMNCYSRESLDRKMADLKNAGHQTILVPEYLMHIKAYHTQSESAFISMLFIYPYTKTKVFESQDMYVPIYDYIRENYITVMKVKDAYLLMQRKGTVKN